MEGNKYDHDKAPFHLIPPEALYALCSILKYGAHKYEERNWEAGMKWSRLFSASMRHMWCWWAGSEERTTHNFAFGPLDDETGFSHLWHALACLVFLVTYEERVVGEDDRP
jgi:hypothetical protein